MNHTRARRERSALLLGLTPGMDWRPGRPPRGCCCGCHCWQVGVCRRWWTGGCSWVGRRGAGSWRAAASQRGRGACRVACRRPPLAGEGGVHCPAARPAAASSKQRENDMRPASPPRDLGRIAAAATRPNRRVGTVLQVHEERAHCEATSLTRSVFHLHPQRCTGRERWHPRAPR